MTKKDKDILQIQAEDFVRNVLDRNFNQKVDPDMLRVIAKKVSRSALPPYKAAFCRSVGRRRP